MNLLELQQVTKEYPSWFRKGRKLKKTAVKNVNLTITKGESIALVGESGSGKSTLAKCIMRIEKITSGHILLDGQNIYTKRLKDFAFYKKVQMVLQDSSSSLHPKMKVEEIIAAPIRNFFPNHKNILDEVNRLLEIVGLDSSFLERMSFQLSGGQKQRVCIAKALAVKPKLIIFDESIASLDHSSQQSIIRVLKQIQQKEEISYLFITHDLESTKHLCNRVAVMYQGEIVEIITEWNQHQLFHPYSKVLYDTINS